MTGIFINYRRDDAPGVAGRLFDHLSPKFSRKNIFMDVDAMKPGLDFVEQLDAHVSRCDVLLAVIGPRWLDAKDQKGQRRLYGDNDYVRIELASALKRKIPVVPVLVDGAGMPSEDELPPDLKPLVRRHALELRHTRFVDDAEAIVGALEELAPPRRLPWRFILAGATIVAGVAAVAVLWPRLADMLRPVGPPIAVSQIPSAPSPSVAVTQHPPQSFEPPAASPVAPANPAVPSRSSTGPESSQSSAVMRNKNPVDGGMPATVGDTYDAITTGYQTYERPSPSPWDKKTDWLYLKDQGVEFFFDTSNRISSIHFVAPWSGSIRGVRLGDTIERIKSLLGEPQSSDERFGGDTLALTYRWPYTLPVEFHVDRPSNKVKIIMVN